MMKRNNVLTGCRILTHFEWYKIKFYIDMKHKQLSSIEHTDIELLEIKLCITDDYVSGFIGTIYQNHYVKEYIGVLQEYINAKLQISKSSILH